MPQSRFNPDDPIAFFLTWTCYGTWLPGDDRGWHDWGIPGTQQPAPRRVAMAMTNMKELPFLMDPTDRETVSSTVTRHCQIRGWKLHCVHARSNHVHVVVTAPGYSPETVRDQFKAWCTRHLKATHANRKQFWTEGGSCRSINDENSLESVMAYVLEAQVRKGTERDG